MLHVITISVQIVAVCLHASPTVASHKRPTVPSELGSRSSAPVASIKFCFICVPEAPGNLRPSRNSPTVSALRHQQLVFDTTVPFCSADHHFPGVEAQLQHPHAAESTLRRIRWLADLSLRNSALLALARDLSVSSGVGRRCSASLCPSLHLPTDPWAAEEPVRNHRMMSAFTPVLSILPFFVPSAMMPRRCLRRQVRDAEV